MRAASSVLAGGGRHTALAEQPVQVVVHVRGRSVVEAARLVVEPEAEAEAQHGGGVGHRVVEQVELAGDPLADQRLGALDLASRCLARLRLDGVEPDHAGERAPPDLVVEDRLDREAAAGVAREQHGAQPRQPACRSARAPRARTRAGSRFPTAPSLPPGPPCGSTSTSCGRPAATSCSSTRSLSGGEVARRRADVPRVVTVQVDEHVDLRVEPDLGGEQHERAADHRQAVDRDPPHPRDVLLAQFAGRGLRRPSRRTAGAAVPPREQAARGAVAAGAQPVEPDRHGIGEPAHGRRCGLGGDGAVVGRAGLLLHRPIMPVRRLPGWESRVARTALARAGRFGRLAGMEAVRSDRSRAAGPSRGADRAEAGPRRARAGRRGRRGARAPAQRGQRRDRRVAAHAQPLRRRRVLVRRRVRRSRQAEEPEELELQRMAADQAAARRSPAPSRRAGPRRSGRGAAGGGSRAGPRRPPRRVRRRSAPRPIAPPSRRSSARSATAAPARSSARPAARAASCSGARCARATRRRGAPPGRCGTCRSS